MGLWGFALGDILALQKTVTCKTLGGGRKNFEKNRANWHSESFLYMDLVIHACLARCSDKHGGISNLRHLHGMRACLKICLIHPLKTKHVSGCLF